MESLPVLLTFFAKPEESRLKRLLTLIEDSAHGRRLGGA
jgi:hypothetical protein